MNMATSEQDMVISHAVVQSSTTLPSRGSRSMYTHDNGADSIPMATFTATDEDSGALYTLGNEENYTRTGTEFSLPPADKGINAIMILISGFFVEGCVSALTTYGLPLSYSILQNYYITQPEFQDAGITSFAIVGALWSGLTLMGAGLVAVLGARFSLKAIMYTGSFIMAAGFIGASFATSIRHLILTQGVILGIGSSFVSNAFMPFVPMWWFKYRGIATGVIFSGAGLMGLVGPIAIEKLLATVGFRWTLRILGLFTLFLCLGSSFTVRPRYLPDASGTLRVSFAAKDFGFLTSRKFIILGACVLFQGLGYFIPNLFIRSYALFTGAPDQVSTTLVSVMNAMTVVGQLLLGHVSDRYGYWKALVISSSVASLSTFVLWRLAGSSLAKMFVYVIIYGCFGAGFTTCFPAMVADIADDPNQFILISGAFMMLRGTGNIVGNPLGSILLTAPSNAQSGWNEVTYLVGSFLLLSAAFGGLRGILAKQSLS